MTSKPIHPAALEERARIARVIQSAGVDRQIPVRALLEIVSPETAATAGRKAEDAAVRVAFARAIEQINARAG